jgi:hypothetical protein
MTRNRRSNSASCCRAVRPEIRAVAGAGSRGRERAQVGRPFPWPGLLQPAVHRTSFSGSGSSQQEVVWNDSNSAIGTGGGGGPHRRLAVLRGIRVQGPTLAQNLYNVVASHHFYICSSKPQAVRDNTSGNNDYTPSGYTGGLYPATRGYDMASGLGAPMVSGLSNHTWHVFLAGLTQLLCHQSATKLKTVKVTSVSPRSGPAGKENQGHGPRDRVLAHRLCRRGPDPVRVQGSRDGRRQLHHDRAHHHDARRIGADGRHQDLRRIPLVECHDEGGSLHVQEMTDTPHVLGAVLHYDVWSAGSGADPTCLTKLQPAMLSCCLTF